MGVGTLDISEGRFLESGPDLENIPGGSHPGYNNHLLVGTLTKFTDWVLLVYNCGGSPNLYEKCQRTSQGIGGSLDVLSMKTVHSLRQFQKVIN